MREARLRWYGHVLRGEEDSVRKIGLNFEVIGKRPRGRPKQRWANTLHTDLKVAGVHPDLALDRESQTLLMAADPESRPLYFANGDFAKTVADIIASPRRGKAYTNQDALFEISDRQREYYHKCFRHLMKHTQGSMSTDGALNGGDFRVVQFFRRSGLDNDSLSRIWALSDVNEDGWLDVNEFSTAMHLIVLKVKGQVAIPICLPACIRPPIAPPHISSHVQYTPSASGLVARGPPSSGSWDQFENAEFPVQSAVSTVKKDTHLAEFSDVPPLLVDSRPTAVKQTIPLLALKSPSGPPPQPPPRPQQRGHTRSASLDMMKNIQLSQTGMPLLSGDRRPSDSTTTAVDRTTSLTTSGNIPTAPPPPIPHRVSPPAPTPRKSSAAGTQTDGRFVEAKEVEQFISEFGGFIALLVAVVSCFLHAFLYNSDIASYYYYYSL
ncbi:unnamed protein product [Heligmosomoides polygyrus]|uniref:EF-hand domain-containing protein n=1 Tax=Heligmosomoides polygyrus TaxID=6339 RepID=A0A3P8AXP7_HELPZ|nr:unnamed protein product [Heligmosomoides polygyrus]